MTESGPQKRTVALSGPAPPCRLQGDDVLLIVSDVDGTILDRNGCFPLPLAAFRTFLGTNGGLMTSMVHFALASSRTLPELILLQRLLRAGGALIAEDGGVLAIPGREEQILGVPSGELIRRLRSLPGARSAILADMSTGRLKELGFRTPAARVRAIHSRRASVLLDLDHMSEKEKSAFVLSSDSLGVEVKRGGRWHTAVSGANKGRALRALQSELGREAGARLVTAAIGNEENDVSLLSNSNIPFVVRNPGRGHHPALASVPGCYMLEDEGVAGFVEMYRVLTLCMEVPS